MENQWVNMINGTDIRGIVIENNSRAINLTEDMIRKISKAFLIFLSKKKNIKLKDLKISIGIDSRISSENLKNIFIEETIMLGCTVYDCGLCSTPSMFMSTLLDEYKIDGAVEVTASHLPYYYNGFKFFTNSGGIDTSDIIDIINIAKNKIDIPTEDLGEKLYINLIDIYSKFLADKIISEVNSREDRSKPLKDFKIIVDAGNGVGGFYAEKVLKKLGANISGSQFLEPDGMFPNHIPNPENTEAMLSIKQAVLKNKADLGIIFDTDVDRVAIVDSNGREINKNLLIALMSSIVLEEYPNSTIVTDSVTSNGLKIFIENHGGIHKRFKRGYKNVINEAIRCNENGIPCYIAMETSGHAALKENYFLDDGAYLATKIIIKMAKFKNDSGEYISDLIKTLKIPYDSTEYRLKINSNNFREYWEDIKSSIKQRFSEKCGWSIDKNNYEGIRVTCDKINGNGWFLLRPSLHEPLFVLNIESDSKDGVKYILKNIYDVLKYYPDIKTDILCSKI